MSTRTIAIIIAALAFSVSSRGLSQADSALIEFMAAQKFKDEGHVSKSFSHRDGSTNANLHKNFGNEIIYQIVVDRFANGNRDNDCLYEARFCARGNDARDWYRYAGGDLRGLIDRMDYLKRLGVTRLWLTPVFENQLVTVLRDKHGSQNAEITSYHGYWIKDWFRLNPFFTDRGAQDYAIFEELLSYAAPQIKIYLDSVTNHSNPADATQASIDFMHAAAPVHGRGPEAQRGIINRDGRYVASYGEDNSGWFHHNPILRTPADWEDPGRVQYWSLDGLADLKQDNPDVQDYLKDAHAFWLRRFPKLAGYRMDTIKHVSPWYWQKFSRDVFSEFPETSVFGEYWSGGPYEPGSVDFYKSTRMSVLDFNFRDLMRYIFKDGGSFSTLSMLWEQDARMGDARSLVTFLDSHDVARLRGEGMSHARMRQAIALWMVARGIPCIYYGMEQDLFVMNDPGDPYNRPPMASFDEQTPFYQMFQRLIELRKANPALRYGSTHVVHETNNIFGFERIEGDSRVFFATSKNESGKTDEFAMFGLSLPDGIYRDILSGTSYDVRGGVIDLKLNNGDVVLLSTTARQN